MMAFKPPPELKSRIECIKKKFEVIEHSDAIVNADDMQISSENGSLCQSKSFKNDSLQEHSENYPTCKTEKSSEAGNCVKNKHEKIQSMPSNSSGKGNIRRRPAFRCEKLALSKQCASVIPVTKTSSVVNNRVKMFENKETSKSIVTVPGNHFRNNVEHNRNPSGEGASCSGDVSSVKCSVNKYNAHENVFSQNVVDTKISCNYRSNLCSTSPLYKNESLFKCTSVPGFGQSGRRILPQQHLEGSESDNLLHQDSDSKVRVASGKHMNEETCGLSSSLKAALEAPLPKGPPPKKPPRTFVHRSPEVSIKKESLPLGLNNLKIDVGNTNSKNPSKLKLLQDRKPVEAHLMLEKLENVLLKHQHGIGSVVLKPRSLSREVCPKEENISGDELGKEVCKSSLSKYTPMNGTIKDHKKGLRINDNVLGGCFNSLNCVSNSHFYESLKEKQSEFFVSTLVDSFERKNDEAKNAGEYVDKGNGGTKLSVKEHIYAEPYAFIDVETILRAELYEPKQIHLKGKCDDTDKSPDKTPAALHYMCSPINAMDRIDALLNGNGIDEFRKNTIDLSSKVLLCEETKHSDCDIVQSRCPDKIAQKSFLPFSSLSKNHPPNRSFVTSPKLDRSKVQLFINQAFGSPLHGSPVTPLDSLSSDESLATTPDPMNPPSLDGDNEGEGRSATRGKEDDEVSTHESECSVDAFFDKHREMSKLTEERKVYVRRVSSRVFSTRQRVSSKSITHLYHCIMLIGLNLDGEKKTKVPYIKSKYPPNAVIPPLIEHLCFPDAADWPPKNNLGNEIDEQSYSLVITNEMGDHMFGYCRRVMPEGTDICLPLAYCILSPVRAKGFYFKILAELESQHGQPEWCQKAFIKELYACEFPSPGQSLRLPSSVKEVPGSVEKVLLSLASQLRRPLDSRLEEQDLNLLFSCLTIPILIQVFASLLLERKVLFISNSLSKLSSCIEALHSILYPFSWQYTFIPVLPSAQFGVCEAPTPYVIGLLKDKEGRIPAITVEEGIVVELEQPKILQSVGDESTILPPRLKKCLKMALHLVESTTEQSEPDRNVLISEAFIRMFVEMCGHYSTHIVTQQDGKKMFERESFIKSVPSQSVQLFLEWFTETAMFTIFIESRLEEGTDNKGLFEQRALEHSEEMDKNTMLFLRNYKAINKKVKSFGDRLKDWTPFT